ncbi:alcohol dehydrogenase catalytic domain-containing protein [Modicisalibacter coralii]|uniref:alcohol dehydrogenase catalytic domain-containing protein n=1 Tax=Modicisalibacter coralii TaxID=2304602 RepID=UPI00100BD885|nr:alcohol dehydrogenase catalytic domain-containing protein [Halomonas coralii]
MRAMQLHQLTPVTQRATPLRIDEIEAPQPAAGQVLIEVGVCGVCHTELDEIEGRLPPPRLPLVPGHQVVGTIIGVGRGVNDARLGERVGVGWIASACGECDYCRSDRENLCPEFVATGRDIDGGYAERMVVDARFACPIPGTLDDAQVAPLLCAGAIGYRSLRLAALENGEPLGLTGFGGSAHLVLQLVRHRYPDSAVFVFARNAAEREFARQLGARWTGNTHERPPEPPAAIIDTTPAWTPIVATLGHLAPGGRLVINAIRKEGRDQSALLALEYPSHLWLEKRIQSVANVTRRDIVEFLELAAEIDIRPTVRTFPLEEANRALIELKTRSVRGAKVLKIRE